MDLKAAIRSIPDFPRKGIVFRDITTLIIEPKTFKSALDLMEKFCRDKKADKIVAIESRGFIFGGALSDRLGVGFIPVRKKGKLPAKTVTQEYELEYGTDIIEMHADAVKPGEKVIVIDDLVATGGTLEAACKMIEKVGGEVAGIAVLIDLAFIPWRKRLGKYDILTLIQYDSE
ncbi:MAG: adenine phosphoribosyltransferase [bacterium]|jgi:adenine phosphoribosyltransferase